MPTSSKSLDLKNFFAKLMQLKLLTPMSQDLSHAVQCTQLKALIAKTTLSLTMTKALATIDFMPSTSLSNLSLAPVPPLLSDVKAEICNALNSKL